MSTFPNNTKIVEMITDAVKYCVVYLLIVTANVHGVTSKSKDVHLTKHDKTYIWVPQTSESITVTTDERCQIAVQVLKCNLDTEKGEYATLFAGPNNRDNGMMFTYDVKEKPLYLYNENHVYADVVLAGQSTLSTIKFNFTRIGDAASSTTVAPTTTEDPLYPIPSGDVSDYSIVVNVSGKTLAKFRQEGNRQMFKRTLSKMAQAFCIKNDIRPSKPITTSSIDILWTSECPATWTNCAPCVSCGFAIPLFFNKSATTRDYQLTADNLDSMWRAYADNYLDGGLRVCQPPDTVGLVKWQLIAFSAITVIFVIGLLVIRHFTIRINDRIRSKILKSDDQWSDKKSILKDLGPHPLQEMPQIFEDTISDHNQYALISNPVEPVLRKTFEGK